MNLSIKKNLIKKTFIIIVSLFSSLYAWDGGNTFTVTGSGNTVIDHPPGLANDMVSNTYAAFKPGTDGWLKISLEEDSLVRGIKG